MRCPLLFVLVCAGPAFGLTPDERMLARQGLEPTRASLGHYLRSLRPDDATRARVDRWIALLGSRDPDSREHAMRELMRLEAAPIAALERATLHDEPEVRSRARLLLDAVEGHGTAEVLYAVFRVIRARRITGLASEVLHVIPIARDAHVRREALEALVATARPDDLGLLLHAATAGVPNTRMACFAAIRRLSGEQAKPVLREALRSPSDRVRLSAAFELANLGERDSLPALVELLNAPDAWIRFRAVATLRSIGGRVLGYSAGVEAARRAPGALRWREWLAGAGATVEWKTPLRWFTTDRGRTLVSVYSGGKVLELDDDGKIVWTLEGLRNPWAVRGLVDGHRLISLFSDNVVHEYDEKGKLVWRSDRLPGNISSVDRLPNGNILVALGTKHDQLLEISRGKQVVWKLSMSGRPVSARVLPGGNLLVALHDKGTVVEIDRAGRVQWRVQGLKKPYSAQRLPNGNVLVACYGGKRLAEFDRDGALVGERSPIEGLYTAERLPDGSTMYADKSAVFRYGPDGKLAWRKSIPGNFLYIDRY